MSEEKKQPEMAGSPAAPAEDLPVATEPAFATAQAPAEAAKGATAQVAEAGPVPLDV